MPVSDAPAPDPADSPRNPPAATPQPELSWRQKQWWKLEKGFPAASTSEQGFAALIRDARTNYEPQGIRDEIRRDVIPFYLLGAATRKDFIDVRSKMWLDHVHTYSRLKNRGDPAKSGSTEIDYAAGHLDIIDRKFGVLLTIQSLIGFVISLTAGTFKEKLLPLLDVPKDKLFYTVAVLFLIFVVSAWRGSALSRVKYVFVTGLVLSVGLFYLRFWLPDYLACGFIVSLSWLWFTTTLMCLRGAGRARWGEMKSIGNDAVHADLSGDAKTEHDSQVMNLIRALVGRTAIYRATVLLVFTNLYCLVLTGYVTGLVLTRDQVRKPPTRQAEIQYEIRFASGDTCDTSPTALSDIAKIANEIEKRDPIGLLIVGSADSMPVRRNLRESLGDNATLALSRAECVSGRITKLLRVNNKNVNFPIEVTTRAAYDRSPQARSKGRESDRVVEVHLVKPVI